MMENIPFLFWLRKAHLQQIADRWFCLHSLLSQQRDGDRLLGYRLEPLVCRRLSGQKPGKERSDDELNKPSGRKSNRLFKRNIYVKQEFALNLALSCPLYVGMIAAVYPKQLSSLHWTSMAAAVIIPLHVVISAVILGRERLPDRVSGTNRYVYEQIESYMPATEDGPGVDGVQQ
ncbi:MAG: hypothetical protein GY835_01250 [bacterium]|nr:hypothetical protein [bacterium]